MRRADSSESFLALLMVDMEEVDHSMVSKSFVEADFRKTVFSMACT
jgi:hypothetical protein